MERYESTKTEFSSECEGSAAQHIEELELLATIKDLPSQLGNGTVMKKKMGNMLGKLKMESQMGKGHILLPKGISIKESGRTGK